MKSLAHPDWPYTGTPWEWRGFAPTPTQEQIKRAIYAQDAEMPRVYPIYQKQSFGPELK